MMDDEVLRCMRQSVLCWLATVDVAGHPNVTPKEIFLAHDRQTLLIANIASAGSERNARSNAAVCVSFVDIFVQKGFKLRGMATVVDAGNARFTEYSAPLRAMAGDRFPFSSLFSIEVMAIDAIIAPSYRLYPETSVLDQVQSAMRSYGVRPAADDA